MAPRWTENKDKRLGYTPFAYDTYFAACTSLSVLHLLSTTPVNLRQLWTSSTRPSSLSSSDFPFRSPQSPNRRGHRCRGILGINSAGRIANDGFKSNINSVRRYGRRRILLPESLTTHAWRSYHAGGCCGIPPPIRCTGTPRWSGRGVVEPEASSLAARSDITRVSRSLALLSGPTMLISFCSRHILVSQRASVGLSQHSALPGLAADLFPLLPGKVRWLPREKQSRECSNYRMWYGARFCTVAFAARAKDGEGASATVEWPLSASCLLSWDHTRRCNRQRSISSTTFIARSRRKPKKREVGGEEGDRRASWFGRGRKRRVISLQCYKALQNHFVLP